MKKLLIMIMAVAVIIATLGVAQEARAYTWTNVGGDPLVPGGVWNPGTCGEKFLNSAKVRKAESLVRSANGQPSWVIANADKEFQRGNIKSSYIARGTKVGAMSYGRNVVRVVKNTTYYGQYEKLPYYYVVSSKTSKVKVSGVYYQKTVSYRVSMAKPCGNVFIFMKKTKLVRMYQLKVEKRCDTASGKRLADWQLQVKVGTKTYKVTSKADKAVLVAWVLPGTKVSASETQQEGWEAVIGKFDTFKMPKATKTLTFVNKEICPPPEKYDLKVVKKEDCSFKLLGGWTIQGVVDNEMRSVVTSSDGPTLVGQYEAGVRYDLTEVLKEGWEIVSPTNGNYSGVMPNHDVTLVYINKPYCPPPVIEKHKIFVKKVNYDTGALIDCWKVSAILDGGKSTLYTSDSGYVLVGTLEEGKGYTLTEESRANWTAKTPATVSGKMGSDDVYVVFKNQYCPPPVAHTIKVCGNVTCLEHLTDAKYSATLNAEVTSHSDSDAITYRWTVNGKSYSTDLKHYYIELNYNTVYSVTLTATDAAGHSAQYTLPAFNEQGPGSPPPPPAD